MPAARTNGATRRHDLGVAVLLASAAAIAGCTASNAAAPDDPPAATAGSAPPPPNTQVFVYPTSGQSSARLDRDRYECHLWAVRQTGYDPSLPQLAPHQRVEVVAMPPQGTGTIAGAATGAIFGAALAGPHDAGGGAAIGAVAGAVLGTASDAVRQQEASRIQSRYDERDLQLQARLERQAADYRRAIGACLEGRGYTVR